MFHGHPGRVASLRCAMMGREDANGTDSETDWLLMHV
jgi:hypothetical protein